MSELATSQIVPTANYSIYSVSCDLWEKYAALVLILYVFKVIFRIKKNTHLLKGSNRKTIPKG